MADMTVAEAREKLARVADAAGMEFIQHHPDDDPMIGCYDDQTGEYLLVKMEAYADRAKGGGGMACMWLWEAVLRLASAVRDVGLMEAPDDTN